jgi:hypothetical protein
MSLGQIVDEAAHYLRGSGGKEMELIAVSNLTTVVGVGTSHGEGGYGPKPGRGLAATARLRKPLRADRSVRRALLRAGSGGNTSRVWEHAFLMIVFTPAHAESVT